MRRAFTLIELLVVISIIALLIAILMPALSRARQLAIETQCGVDQRSLGTASVTWASDHKGYLPDLDYLPNSDQNAPGGYGYGTRQIYYMSGAWKKGLGDYGVVRDSFYSVSNPTWNHDGFWKPGQEANNHQIVIGRIATAGDRGNLFAKTRMTLIANSGYDNTMDKPAFPTRIEDAAVFDLIWADLNRSLSAGSGVFWNTSGQGATHITEDPTVAAGTHLTNVDGSTGFERFENMRHRGTTSWGGRPIWW